jgi:hypothetical protein
VTMYCTNLNSSSSSAQTLGVSSGPRPAGASGLAAKL